MEFLNLGPLLPLLDFYLYGINVGLPGILFLIQISESDPMVLGFFSASSLACVL